MTATTEPEFAAMLQRFSEGDPEASEGLMSLLYSELYQVAQRYMSEQYGTQTLQATALVNEAYLRLLGKRGRATWSNRKHLLSAAATAMRWVLVDHARKRASRQTSESESLALDRVLVTYESRAVDLLALERALQELAKRAPNMARGVELRFFAGLTMDEVADVLGMSKRSFEREWELTRAWLYERLS